MVPYLKYEMRRILFIHMRGRMKDDIPLLEQLHFHLPVNVDIKRCRTEEYKREKFRLLEVCDDRRSPLYSTDMGILEPTFPKILFEYSVGPFLLTPETYIALLTAEGRDKLLKKPLDEREADDLVCTKIRSDELYLGRDDIRGLIHKVKSNRAPPFISPLYE